MKFYQYRIIRAKTYMYYTNSATSAAGAIFF
ncbi:bifunctional aconitate hydratase 2/2-methylisocitrate dehydratase [unidentified eubacterium SCB49]|nr:bifunctional aconitate hydratase 2/2-methylisocitrate dehydratase [unidentified eubacterium SCB49]